MDQEEADFPVVQRFPDDEEGEDGNDAVVDSPASRPDRPASEVTGDEEEEDDDDDESGEDIMKKDGNMIGSDEDEDSSEEEEDDPEEARRIAEGFIVDEDDDEDMENDSDSEGEKKRKKKRRKVKRRRREKQLKEHEDEQLDEDDLDLVAENTGVKRKERKLKRFRRASASPDEQEQASKKPKDLQHIFDDDDEEPVAKAGYGEDEEDEEDDLPSAGQALRAAADRRNRKEVQPTVGFEDEMEDFIDDDESDMEDDLSEGEREARREEKRQQRKADTEARRAKRGGGGFDPGRAGIDAEAWAELNDVFGDGSEYAFALKLDDDDDDDEEGDSSMRKKRAEFKDIFEPAAIKARMMTDEDDRIKRADFPERFQAALPGEEGLQLLERVLTSQELDECTQWVSRKFSYRSNRLFLSETGEYSMYKEAWFKCVRTMVEFIINQRREAMYLYTHRADDHELRIPGQGEGVLELLQRRDFSSLVSSCLKFKTLLHRRDTLRATFARLSSEMEGQAPSEEDRTIFEGMLQRTESTDEVADVSEWLVMRFGQRIRDIQAAQQGGGTTTTSTFKRPTVLGTYESLKSTPASVFASKFGITAVQLAENFTSHSHLHYTQDESMTPTVLADQYVDQIRGPTSIEVAIGAARTLLAHEIGKNPAVKNEARKLFKEMGLVSVEPTDRGHYKIDEEHPYYNFKFLKSKPASQFHVLLPNDSLPAPAQYLMILQAEEELLVNVTIQVDPLQALSFEKRLYESYATEEASETSKLWNDERRAIISQAIESFLFPAAKLWLREWLREECWEFIGRACEISLTKRIDCQPFQSTSMKKRRDLSDQSEFQNYGKEDDSDDEDDEENEKREGLPKVLAVSHGNGDHRKDHIETVFLDAGGRLRQRNEFETLGRPNNPAAEVTTIGDVADPSLEFIQLLVTRRPDVIVVNGFSPRTMTLKQQIVECVEKAVKQIIENKSIPEDQVELAQIDVIHCHDDVARIYQHSSRAIEEFPSFNSLARYCIALARYVQSPVQEFAALTEEDLLALRYDAYQQLIPRDRLLNFLERALVAVVNTTAIDINRAVVNAYYAQQLRYVSGLGPRKADSLMRSITSQLGSYVVNRDSLLIGAAGSQMLEADLEILSSNVWHNACSFLIIRPRQGTSTVRKVKMQGRSDVLDSTRIHPESYGYARFIAFDALRKTEEDREDDQHPSAWCAELMEDPGRRLKVEDIDMADYERNLWAEMARRGQRRERKLSLLEFIARELVDAMAELRNDFVLPNPDEVLTMLSGETKATFDTQRLVNVQVTQLFKDFIKVHLESGIEGTIHFEYLLPMDMADLAARGLFDIKDKKHHTKDLVKRGQLLKAQIIDIDVLNVRAELTARESHVEAAKIADMERRKVAVDPRYFDVDRAKVEKDQAEIRRVKKQNASRGARFIRHPDFHNFKAGQAEEYLANMPRGTAIVRPSSKGNDHLAVTWKVFDGVYQHIDVLELDKENDYELGKILRVGSVAGSSYSDLDELLVNHVAPMARMVEMLTLHEKFRGSEESLQTYLSNASLANPGKSQYGFAVDKKRPGIFVLGFKASRSDPIQRWAVRVLPGRFKLGEAELPDVTSLTNSFKVQIAAKLMGAVRRGAATPRVGAGGMTPYGSSLLPPGPPPTRPGPPPARPTFH